MAATRTFQAVAEELIADKAKGWRNDKHRAQWETTLTTYAYPVFGDWPVQDVDNDAVMRVLRPLWDRAPETGSRLRGRIEAVLDAARAQGLRTGENPARWKGHTGVAPALAAQGEGRRAPPCPRLAPNGRLPGRAPGAPWRCGVCHRVRHPDRRPLR